MKKLLVPFLALFLFILTGLPANADPALPAPDKADQSWVKQSLRHVDLLLRYLSPNPNVAPADIEKLVEKKMALESMLPKKHDEKNAGYMGKIVKKKLALDALAAEQAKSGVAEKSPIPDISAMQALIAEQDRVRQQDSGKNCVKSRDYGPRGLGAFARQKNRPSCPIVPCPYGRHFHPLIQE